MKTTLTLKGIKFQGIEVGEVRFDNEYSVTEAVKALNAGKNFVKDLIKELPEIMQDVNNAETAMNKIFDTVASKDVKEEPKSELVKETREDVIDRYCRRLNYCKLECGTESKAFNDIVFDAYFDKRLDSKGYDIVFEHAYKLEQGLL